MNIEKKISKSGNISIPKFLRIAKGIEEGDRFEITIDDQGRIILNKTYGSCVFCKNKDSLKSFKGIDICSDCIEMVGK